MVPSKVKLGVIHPAVQSGPSVSVHKVPSVNSGTSPTQSVPSGTVHMNPKAIPTVQPGVHVLDHGPENKTNRTERLAYLREQLALNESVLTEKEQNEVLEIFLRYFDACSISDEDFGASNLLQFHITLLPGSVPVRSKCEPLNPNQEAVK